MSQHFDYIIVGAGCAGLSLLMRLLDDPLLSSKKILLTDRVQKNLDDRTWCFWEKEPGYFEPVVFHKWPRLMVRHPQGEIACNMGGYAYKMIRGIDFYNYCFRKINGSKNVTVLYGETTAIEPETGQITLNGNMYKGDYIFSSVLPRNPILQKKEFYLLQHFKGWWIETDEPFFDAEKADLMNFRVSQKYGCAFVYVMPVSSRKALVEYTLFTENLLKPEEYEQELKEFIKTELKIDQYGIYAVENGVIPMTNYRFTQQEGKVIYIGTAGGQTKASTGYTFQNIQSHAEGIVTALSQKGDFKSNLAPHARFRFYDGVLLRVLQEEKVKGADVFFRLFAKNPAWKVLRFLDNKSNLTDELGIMYATPKWTFAKAALAQLL